MARSAPAHVAPAVLRWARESLGYGLEDAASKIGVRVEKLEGAERGEELLTLRQAEKAARVYHRSLAALFLPEPPVEESQETQFRRLPDAPTPPWPPEMQILARRVRGRQDAAGELYELLDEEPPWPAAVERLGRNASHLAEVTRELLGITFEEQESWRDAAGFRPLRHWVDAVEDLGVLVMQDGTLPVETMRGFASTHASVPAIVVNTNDDARARAFTTIHELGHLCLEAVGGAHGSQPESWYDEYASSVLMPAAAFEEVFRGSRARDLRKRIDDVALTFGVTPMACAVTAARRHLISQSDANAVIARIGERGPRTKRGGGNYYRNELTRLGPAFTRLVFNALDGQALTYPAASSLLGVKVNRFRGLRDHAERRAEMA